MKGSLYILTILFTSSGYLHATGMRQIAQRMPSPWQNEAKYGLLSINYDNGFSEKKSLISRYWAQEAIGSPEGQELIAEWQRMGVTLKRSNVAIFDVGFYLERDKVNKLHMLACNCLALAERYRVELDSTWRINRKRRMHGMKVAAIIGSKSPVGVASNTRISLLSTHNPFAEERLLSYDVINHSVQAEEFVPIPPHFAWERAFADESIFVQAAGNNFPKPAFGGEHAHYSEKVILVGSSDPGGFVSYFSQPSKNISVMAPGDRYVSSLNINTYENRVTNSKFGGTSAAAAVVSAVLADVKSIIPNLTTQEAAYLLQKTAIKTSTNMVSDANGAGVVNHYKMLRVAKRLADAGFTADPDRRKVLYLDKMYDFTSEAGKLVKEAEQSIDNAVQLKKLRLAFFLNPDNNSTRQMLSDIYREFEHEPQALFYGDPSQAVNHSDVRQKFASRIYEFKRAVFTDIEMWIEESTGIKQKKLAGILKNFIRTHYPHTEMDFSYNKDFLTAVENSNFPKEEVLLFMLSQAVDVFDNNDLLELLVEYTKDNYPSLLTRFLLTRLKSSS